MSATPWQNPANLTWRAFDCKRLTIDHRWSSWSGWTWLTLRLTSSRRMDGMQMPPSSWIWKPFWTNIQITWAHWCTSSAMNWQICQRMTTRCPPWLAQGCDLVDLDFVRMARLPGWLRTSHELEWILASHPPWGWQGDRVCWHCGRLYKRWVFTLSLCLPWIIVGFTDIMISIIHFSAKAGSDMIGKLSSHAIRQKEMLSMMRSLFV